MRMWWNANCDLVCGRLQLLNNEPERASGWIFFIYFYFFTRPALMPDGHRHVQRDDFRKQTEKGEIREEKGSNVRRRRKALHRDAQEAALVDAPSSQLTESVINSLALQGTVANHQAWLPNTLTWNISKAYHCTHAINTTRLFRSGLQCLELSLTR